MGTKQIPERLMTSPLTPFSLQRLRGLAREDLSQRVTLQLEDGSYVILRDKYVEQLHRLCNESGNVDTAWLNCDATSVYFVTRTGTRLRVFETSLVQAPNVHRQAAMRSSSATAFPSMHVILDQSGSMSSMNDDVYAGAREVIEDLPDEAVVTFTTFNHIVTLGERRSKADVLASLVTRSTSGTTALRDAIVRAVEYEERDPHDSTSVVVVTDGIDNASASTIAQVRSAVQRCTDRGWRVLFLGANQDAVTTASQYGIDGGLALTFDGRRAPQAFRSLSEVVRVQRTTGVDAAFTATHRQTSMASS